MQRQPTVAGQPAWTMGMVEQATDQGPSFARVARLEECGGFDATVEDIRFVRATGRNLPNVFQRNASVGRKADGGFLRIGPAFSEIVAEAEERTPIVACGSPDAATARAVVVSHGVDDVPVEVRAADFPASALRVRAKNEGALGCSN